MKNVQKSKINLKTLAEHLGISQTTVSRALNGFPEVSEKTRKRVVDAALSLNYRPNPSASSLATGKTGQIGHIIPLSQHMMINPHFADFMAGAGEAYSAAGYDALLRVSAEEDEETVYRDFAQRNRVDGIVVHGPLVEDNRIGLLKSLDIPFVVHGRSQSATVDYSWLDVNNTRAFERAVDFLVDLGHRRIALVNGLEKMNFAHRRHLGYAQGLQKHGIEIDKALVTSADMVEPYGFEATSAFLSQNDPPTAIIYSSILPAMGGHRAISNAGLRIGDDVSVIAFDDELSFLQPAEMPVVPTFTSLRSSIRAAGRQVAKMLIRQIANRDQPPQHALWEADFVLGESTKPIRNRQAA